MFQVSPMHLFRAKQSEAQFLFKTAQQEFEVLMTHGDRVAIHSEFLLSHWAMPFIQRHHTAFQTGCKETCSIICLGFSAFSVVALSIEQVSRGLISGVDNPSERELLICVTYISNGCSAPV